MFFRNISADYRRITDLLDDRPWIARVFYPFSTGGFQTLILFRLVQANRHWRIPVLHWIIAIILRIIAIPFQAFWGICIASNADIGPGLYIAHHGMIFIGVKKMGANCTIGHNVTTGRTEKEHGYPTLGDNVYLAPGAMVIGNIQVGDNVKIGPYAVVRRNIPANSVVVSPPPRVIKLTGKAEWEKWKDNVEEKSSVNGPKAGAQKSQPAAYGRKRDSRDSRNYRDKRHQPRKQHSSKDGKQPSAKGQSGSSDRRDNPQKDRQTSRPDARSIQKTSGQQQKPSNRPQTKSQPRNQQRRNSPSKQPYRPDNRDRKPRPTDRQIIPQEEPVKPTGKDGEGVELVDLDVRHRDTSWNSNNEAEKWSDDMDGESLNE